MRRIDMMFSGATNCGTSLFGIAAASIAWTGAHAQGTAASQTGNAAHQIGSSTPGDATAVAAPSSSNDGTEAPTADARRAGSSAAGPSGDIVVTGSRVVSDGSQAPTPVTVVGAEQIRRQAPALLIDLARTLPQFKNTTGAQNGGTNTTAGGQSALNLRGLGINRNLVLLDGRRIAPSTPTGVVNIDVLPSALVKRIDIVTGGASAAYGSDAVSGVVNFVLDTDFTGLSGAIQDGIASVGDNFSWQAALTGGTSFAGDRGHIVVSAEYFDADGIGPFGRAFLRRRTGIIANTAYTAANGQPQRLVTDGIVSASMTTGGLIDGGVNANGTTNTLLRGIAFGVGGVPYNFRYGSNFTTTSTTMIAPPGANLLNGEYTDIGDPTYAALPSNRKTIFSHIKYDVGEAFTVYAEGLYADVKTGPFNTAAPYRFGTSAATAIQIKAENPFLPASVAARMSGIGGGNAAGPATIYLGRNSLDWGGAEEVHLRNRTARGVAGANGKVFGDWKWDAYYQYGQNRYSQLLPRNLIVGNLNLAADAVRAPAGNALNVPAGTIVCRSTLTNTTNGCVPINVFGYGSASPAAIDYVLGEQTSALIYRQHVVEGDLSGKLFRNWAGNVLVDIGASYRSEYVNQTSDALSQQRAFVLGNPQPFTGRYNVKEVFGEIAVPLMKDSPIGRSMDLNLAARLTDYSLSGKVTTWKVGLSYEPIQDVRLRVTRSRDIRAPSLTEYFLGAQQQVGTVIDPVTNVIARPQSVSSGSTNLIPEKANTWTAGVVLQPRFVPGLTLTVDYYDIRINGVIAQLTDQQVVDRCAGGNAQLCSLITRSSGVISQILRPFLNLSSLKTNGVDVEASYRVDLSRVGLAGGLGLRALASYVHEFASSDGVTVLDTAGSVGDGQPHWTGRGDVVYAIGGSSIGVIGRYVGPGVYSNNYNAPNAINNNRVGAKWYFSLNLQQKIMQGDRSGEIFAVVDNIFNSKPPIGFVPGNGINPAPLYETVGTMFRLGIRFKL